MTPAGGAEPVLPRPRTGEGASGGGVELQRLLRLARTHLGMEVAWASEFSGGRQVIRAVSGDAAALGVAVGTSLEESFCARVLSGALPAVVAQARRHPVSRELAVTRDLGIGSYVGVPLHGPDGAPVGMLCCLSRQAGPDLDDVEAPRFLALLAGLVSDHLSSSAEVARRAAALEGTRVRSVLDAGAVGMVFQPIVRLRDGELRAFEALARFEDPRFPTPAHAFAAAARAGLGVELELLAVQRALAQLRHRPPGTGLGVNLSAEALLTPHVQQTLLAHADRAIIVELTEHTQVQDYDELSRVTSRLQGAGIQVAIDDAGAGYASLRHILRLRPDAIKLDLEITRDVDTDPVRQALTRSLVAFATDIDAFLIAEGIETPAELATLRRLGVELGQGYLIARPGPLPAAAGRADPAALPPAGPARPSDAPR